MNTRIKIKDTTEAVVRYWEAKGFDVSEGSDVEIVNGLPSTVKTVTPRSGNARLHSRIHLSKIAEQVLGNASEGEFEKIRDSARAQVVAGVRLEKIIRDLDEASELRARLTKSQIEARKAKDILNEISDKHDFTIEELKGKSRRREIMFARFEAYYRLSVELGLNMARVGRAMGGRDHTTIIHGISRYKEICKERFAHVL